MNNNRILTGLCAGVLSCFCSSLSAELLINPSIKSEAGESGIGTHFGSSTTPYLTTMSGEHYTVENGSFSSRDKVSILDVERQYLTAYYSYGVARWLGVFVGGGVIGSAALSDAPAAYENSWAEGATSGGRGFMLGGGIHGGMDMPFISEANFQWYSQFLMTYEDYGSSSTALGSQNMLNVGSGSQQVLTAGIIIEKTFFEDLSFYGGGEFALYSGGDFESKGAGLLYSEANGAGLLNSEITGTMERDNPFTLRLGLSKPLFGIPFNLNVGLMGETSFSLGITMPLGSEPSQPVRRDHFDTPQIETKPVSVTETPLPSELFDEMEAEVELTENSVRDVKKSARQRLKEVQLKLESLGYSPGPADGLMGSKTKRAIGQYQKDNGLDVTNLPDDELMESLGLKN